MTDWTKTLASYEAAGYKLIPLHRPDHVDDKGRKRGKSPRDKDWRRRTYSRAELLDHAARGGNIGVRLEADDVVVDVDPRNFPEGRDPIAELEAAMGLDLGAYPLVITGSGGKHYYMRKPKDVPVRNSLAEYPGVEFKTRGQQVVAAGSIHPDGGTYRLDELSPSLHPGRQAPEMLLGLIRRPQGVGRSEAGKYTPEQLADMLDVLDPEQYGRGMHDKWLELMMACHHATDGQGRAEWVEWCTRDPEYQGAAWDVGQRWDSLTNQGGSGRVTYRTLHQHLSQAGHGDAVPTGDAEGEFEEVGGTAEAEEEDVPEHERKGPLERMNDDYWAVDDNGKFKVMYERIDPTYDPPRRYWVKSARFDFENGLAHRKVQKGEGTVPIAKAWIEWGGRRSAKGVVFDPEREHPGYLNLWTGWAMEPKPGDWSRLDDLIGDVLCDGNDELHAYVLDWCASMVQRPGRPGETALCFQGDRGTGKSTLGRTLARMAGRHGLHITSPEHLTGRFNSHLRDVVLLFADEAVSPYDQAANSRLKGIITEPTLVFEGKGANAEYGRNVIHVLMASNEDWFVPASLKDERRYVVQRVSNRRQGDRAYFGALHEQLDGGGLAGFLWDCLHRDISGWAPQQRVPRTRAMLEQKVRAMGPTASWWLNCLQDGKPPFITPYDEAPSSADWVKGPIRVARADVREHFELHCRRAGVRAGASGRAIDMAFVQELKGLLPEGTEPAVKMKIPADRPDLQRHADGRAWGMELPPLGECRRAMEAFLGGDPGWEPPGEGDDDWG